MSKSNAQHQESLPSERFEQLDVQAVMQRIKGEVRQSLRTARSEVETKTPTGVLTHLTELNYLNKNYAFPDTALDPKQVTSHWPLVGIFIRLFKKTLYRLIRGKLFFNYFTEQREFNVQLVRCLNEFARSFDQKKLRLDEDYRQSLFAVEDDLRKEFAITLQELRSADASLHARQTLTEERIGTTETIASGIERIVARMSSRGSAQEGSGAAETPVDYHYLMLENRYRGAEDEIKKRVRLYADRLRTVPGAVLEIGAGRGELQEVFSEAGVESYGFELDAAMVEHCKEKGLPVHFGDGLQHLAECRDSSLGAVIALQVIEHLTPEMLRRFFELARQKVVVGGVVIVETINTESLQALRSNYFRDPTHTQPLHPETTRYLMELAGLKTEAPIFLSPYSEQVQFEHLPESASYPPRLSDIVERMNRNIDRLNTIFFGPQDYAVIAIVE